MIAPKPNGGEVIKSDICLIGGGPASIAIALELIKGAADVVMLVGGGERREAAEHRDLNSGIVAKPGSHEALEENLRRVFGGASSVWGGRCIPFDPLDFKERDWIAHSGWPISYEELTAYYGRATTLCQAGQAHYDNRSLYPDRPDEVIQGFQSAELESHHLERWSPPINFAAAYLRELVQAGNLRVFLDCHATQLRLCGVERRIQRVDAICNGNHFEVQAKTYVLAAGGIENARLLLASRGPDHPRGIGNERDLVGRFYMCHPHGALAGVKLESKRGLQVQYERDAEGVYIRKRWHVSEETQSRLKIGNIVLYLDRPNQAQGHRDALFSCVYLAKSVLGAAKVPGVRRKLQRLSKERRVLAAHSQAVFRDGLTLAPALYRTFRARFANSRRLPSVLPSGDRSVWGLFFQSEQIPNPRSRITLSENEHDAHGMPRAVVDLQFSDLDRKTVLEAHRLFAEAFRASNAGLLLYKEEELEQYLADLASDFNSAAHHIGTTRMAETPDQGVVDRQCKVFGTENLYVAGSSVFPTGGHANPTLTLVALALRLADHLQQLHAS